MWRVGTYLFRGVTLPWPLPAGSSLQRTNFQELYQMQALSSWFDSRQFFKPEYREWELRTPFDSWVKESWNHKVERDSFTKSWPSIVFRISDTQPCISHHVWQPSWPYLITNTPKTTSNKFLHFHFASLISDSLKNYPSPDEIHSSPPHGPHLVENRSKRKRRSFLTGSSHFSPSECDDHPAQNKTGWRQAAMDSPYAFTVGGVDFLKWTTNSWKLGGTTAHSLPQSRDK